MTGRTVKEDEEVGWAEEESVEGHFEGLADVDWVGEGGAPAAGAVVAVAGHVEGVGAVDYGL